MKKVPIAYKDCTLQMQSKKGIDNNNYLFYKAPNGAYYAYTQCLVKYALVACGAKNNGTTRQMAKRLLNM